MNNPESPNFGQVQVYCRIRPLNKKEKRLGNHTCLEQFKDKKRIALESNQSLPKDKSTFKFAHVFDQKNN